jgi:hypothetical protein
MDLPVLGGAATSRQTAYSIKHVAAGIAEKEKEIR